MKLFFKQIASWLFRAYEKFTINKFYRIKNRGIETSYLINLKFYFLIKYFIVSREFILIDDTLLNLLARSLKKDIRLPELKEYLEGANYQIKQYLAIYDFLRYFGLYYFALPFREKAIDEALKIKDNSCRDFFKYYLPAIIEQRRYDLLKKFVDGIESENINSIFYNFLTRVIERKLETTNHHSNFQKFINNKKIAIVTPGSSDIDDGKAIDLYDLVVRFNKINSLDIDNKIYGNKINISYTNNENVKPILNSIHKGASITTDFICFKSRRYFSDIMKEIKDFKEIRYLDDYNHLCFHQSFNLLPLTLLDLIFNGKPKKVKIYKSDIMLSSTRAVNYFYAGHPAAQDGVGSFNSSPHDPISNFVFLRNLYHLGLFQGDKKMEHVLSMSVSKYSLEMQEIYSI